MAGNSRNAISKDCTAGQAENRRYIRSRMRPIAADPASRQVGNLRSCIRCRRACPSGSGLLSVTSGEPSLEESIIGFEALASNHPLFAHWDIPAQDLRKKRRIAIYRFLADKGVVSLRPYSHPAEGWMEGYASPR